jgi:hypothetical protein
MEADPAYPGSNPDYKLIIFAHPVDPTDTPNVRFFNLEDDENEQTPLYSGPHPDDPTYVVPSLSATELAAFNACIQKDRDLYFSALYFRNNISC